MPVFPSRTRHVHNALRLFGAGAAALFALSGVVELATVVPAGASTVAQFNNLEIQPSGSGTTPAFTVGEPWALAYTYSCGLSGSFSVTVNQPSGDTTDDPGISSTGGSNSGTEDYSDTGTFTLKVISACQWSITISTNSSAPVPPLTYSSSTTGLSGTTSVFQVTAPWTVNWAFSCSNSTGNFAYVVNEPTDDAYHDPGPNLADASGQGYDTYPDAGQFTISVTSSCPWALTVYEGTESADTPTPTPPTGGVTPTQPVTPEPPAPSNAVSGGYDLVGSDGGVFVFGNPNGYYGSLPGEGIDVNNIVGIVPTTDGQGYFLVGSDGGVFTFGDAPYEGSLPGEDIHVNDIVGIAPTADDQGYVLVGRDGGVFTFGDANYEGSLPAGDIHVSDIAGITPTSDSDGYWLVASTGTIYYFGDAASYGASAAPAGSRVVGIQGTHDTHGYWVVTNDGVVYPFGDAGAYGSLSNENAVANNITDLVPTLDGAGYWLIGANGSVYSFGDAVASGSLPLEGVSVDNIVGGAPTA